jgi:predicted metal-binding protein
LLALLRPVSESHLANLLAEAGVRVEQPFAGVNQKSLDELETSLDAMGNAYAEAKAQGDLALARECRRVVIQARRRARFASKNAKVSEQKRVLKAEMAEWMLVWLENPPVFPAWAKLRRSALAGRGMDDY